MTDVDAGDLAPLAPADPEAALAELAARYDADRMRWQLAVSAGGVGSFDWDLVSGRLDWDDQLLEIFGIARDAFGSTIEAFNAALDPDDLPRVSDALQAAIATCTQYVAEYRVIRGDGSVRWVKARGMALAGPDGTAVRLMGAAYDTTAERDAEARVDRILETMPDAFFLLDEEWRFTYVNAAAEHLLGSTRDALLSVVVWDAYPQWLGTDVERECREAVAAVAPRLFEAFVAEPVDRWCEVRAWPGPDGLSVYLDDISERRRAQDEVRTARAAAEDSSRRLRLLAQVSDDLSSTLETEEAVRRLATHLVPTFGTWCLVTMSEDHRQLRDIAAWHTDPAMRDTVNTYAALRIDALLPDAYLFRTMRTGETIVIHNATESISGVLSGRARDVLRELAPSTAYAIPMRARERTVGAITVFLDEGQPGLTPHDVALLVQLADRAGMALDNARLFGRQREIAVALQRSLLASPTPSEDLHVVVRYVATAEAAQVGGDWYDAFTQPSGETVVVIGDVMGHDTPAAAAMSQLRTLLRGIAHTGGGTPAQVLTSLEDAVRALGIDTMATAVVLRLEEADDRVDDATTLRWTNAGHLPPLLIAPDGTVTELAAPAELLLGLHPGTPRTDHVVRVPRGSTVLLYTDGLVERRGEHLRVGLDRLVAQVVELTRDDGAGRAGRDLDGLVDELLRRLVPESEADDDVAVLAVYLEPGAEVVT
ncbi:SpoIIE family protein phosphatase [Cellulomonas sp. Leaf395]|uniref:SpoIIE family protein phosphatase n=1 Tax=Cellulomonas sp. Leaf395 TaxID=1736362 RepID=UPI0006F20C0C|nr:SpoIIE family protein phosphatase [Cellulomonas sp. Leaf395]KQS97426.1 histidine kinase [Cellulomonas sp. Leaf395]